MKQTAPVKLVRFLTWIIAGILVLLPFHAFLTVWLSSFLGHYTLLRLWKEYLLAPLVAGAAYILFIDKPLRKKILSLTLVRLIGAYSVLLVVCVAVALTRHVVTSKAMWYGLLVDLRFLIFFLAVLVLATKSNLLSRNWLKILLGPAILVAAFGVLQYLVLPHDFLSHFGYGPSTITPYETINHNVDHLRVASTLRGANPLGAYLVIPICALAVLFFREKAQRLNKTILSTGLLLALIFSFSRSAWIGAGLGVLIIVWLCIKSVQAKKNMGWAVIGLVVIAGLLLLILQNNLTFENAIFHTDRASKIAVSSNEGHASAFKSAAKDVLHQPFGGGVGTAGPQSIYNNGQARIAENYILQIGQEAGIFGMLIFIAICVSVGRMLYARRADPLALALFAALIGLSFVNLLSHAWEDDTLAYVWWGLAGIACAPAILKVRNKNGQKQSQS